MKSFGPTVVMGVIALVMCGAAYYYYPKTNLGSVEELVDQSLFEDYDTSDVRYVKIDQFDRERNTLQKIQLAFSGGRWVLPSKNNYLASNAALVAKAVGSLKDRTVLKMVSDQQKDHEKYGVLEIDNPTGATLGVGSLITLEDRNHQLIGELIVGQQTKDGKHFVRKPGQPHIYEIDFDASILQTDFGEWIDGNLLRVTGDQNNPGNQISFVDVQKYTIDPQELAKKAGRSYAYRARVERQENQWGVSVWTPGEDQQLTAEPAKDGVPVDNQTLLGLTQQLRTFAVQNVRKKAVEVADHLANPSNTDSPAEFESTPGVGFRQVGMNHGQHQFDSVAGHVVIQFRNGAQYNIYVGNLAGIDVHDGTKFTRFLLMTAELDETQVPTPTREEIATALASDASKPGEATGQQDTEPADEKVEREYQRQLQQREQIIKAARQQVAQFNQVHADWYYVVGEDAVSRLFPAVESWTTGSPAATGTPESNAHDDHDH